MNGLGELDLGTGALVWDDATYALHGVPRALCPDPRAALEASVLPEDLGVARAVLTDPREPDGSLTLTYRLSRGESIVARGATRPPTDGASARLVLMYSRASPDAQAERLRLIIERSSDGIYLTGPDGRFLEVNPAGAELLGYAAQELLQLRMRDVEDPFWLQSLSLPPGHLPTRGPNHQVRALRRRDGSSILVELSSSALPGGERLRLARDITQRHAHQSVLQARLRLSEVAATGTAERVRSAALDELARMTASPRARFLDPEEARLEHPQAWREAVAEAAPRSVNEPYAALLLPLVLDSGVAGLIELSGRGSDYAPFEVASAFQLLGYAAEHMRRRAAELALAAAHEALTAEAARRAESERFVSQLNNELKQHMAQATTSLARGERNLQSLLATASDGIHVLDACGNVVLCSHSFARMLGYTLAEASRLNVADWDAHFSPDELRAAVRDLFVNPGTFETRHRRKDGSVFDVEINAIATELDGTRYLYASSRDISERKRAAEQYRVMVDNTNTAFAVVSQTGVVLEANQNFMNLIGRSAAEVIGRSVLEWTAPDRLEENAAALARCLAEGRVTDQLMDYVHTAGHRVPISINAAVMDTAQGPVFVAYCRDLTTEQRLLAALQQSNRALEEFAYVASHDLQEPLRMVTSYTELLAERYRGRLDEKADRYITHAGEGARRMQGLITDILAYSRLSTRVDPHQPVSVEDALREALGNLAMAVQEADAEITWEALPAVLADRRQLVQLLQNLIGNALKFRGEQAARVEISAVRDGAQWRLAVSDNGIGLDMQYAERIFGVFQRLHMRSRYPGNGIGLALVKKIVDRHGGRVWLESTPGCGTCVYFTLPAAQSNRS